MTRDRLADHLSDAFTHEELAAALTGIERRVSRRRALRRAAAASTALAAVLAVAALGWGRSPASPLRRIDGRPLAVAAGETVRLTDGSSIALAPGGALSVSEATDRLVSLRLAHGSVRFDIEPGGPRRWTIDAGPLRVEVIGTSFTVTRESSWASVAVARGVVAITTADETRRLYAGERFEIGARTIVETMEQASPTEAEPREIRSRSVARGRPDTPARDLAMDRRTPPGAVRSPRRGQDEAAPSSEDPPQPVADDRLSSLREQADRARREGRIDDATSALWAIIDERADAPEAAAAAVTAGRLEQQRRRFDAAATAYRRALELDPPPALAELCYEALVQCYLALSDRARAEQAAAEYGRAFPQGARTDSIEALLRR